MWTSCFSNLRNIPPGLKPVAISRGIPGYYRGAREFALAPRRDMLKVPDSKFDPLYNTMLLRLDPRKLYDALGPSAVLLCWEVPGKMCHRRNVAEWLEFHLGVVVPEWGFDRWQTGWQSTPAYHFWRPDAVRRQALAEALGRAGHAPPSVPPGFLF